MDQPKAFRRTPMIALVAFVCAAISTSVGQASPSPEMTARDLFWSGAQSANLAANPAQTTQQHGTQPLTADDRNNKDTESNLRAADPGTRLTAKRVSALGYGEAPRLDSSPLGLLGLRYTFLERGAAGGYSEVLPSSTFHAGDKIRLSIMPNQSGYLYIIQRGTSGTWSSLFPDAKSTNGSNQLKAGQLYEFPPGENAGFQFDEHAGTERIFLVYARSEAENVEHLIALLHQAPTVAGGEAKGLAQGCSSAISDGAVSSRDLLIATVGNESRATNAEKAVYVVNQASAAKGDSMIVACLSIVHE